MTPEQEAAAEMREKAAKIADEEEAKCSIKRKTMLECESLTWANIYAQNAETARLIASNIRALPLPEAKPDPRDAALAKAREVLHSARRFIDPYANSVFNDNGDMTVSNLPAIGYEGACNSYFLRRKIDDSLTAIQSALSKAPEEAP